MGAKLPVALGAVKQYSYALAKASRDRDFTRYSSPT